MFQCLGSITTRKVTVFRVMAPDGGSKMRIRGSMPSCESKRVKFLGVEMAEIDAVILSKLGKDEKFTDREKCRLEDVIKTYNKLQSEKGD